MHNVTDLRFDDIAYRGHGFDNNFLFELRATYTLFSLIVLASVFAPFFFLFIVFLLHLLLLIFSLTWMRFLSSASMSFDLWMFRVIYSVVAQKSFDKSSFCLNACIFIVSVGASASVCGPFSCARPYFMSQRAHKNTSPPMADQAASNSKRQLQWMKTFSFCVNKHKHHTLR